MESLYAKLNERTEAATSGYSATGDFLQHIYSVLVAKNHHKIHSRSVNEFSFIRIFLTICHGYRVCILKKNSLWLQNPLCFTRLWLLIATIKRCTE